MVTEEELLHSEQYQYQHIQVQVLQKTENGNVIAFGAKYNTKPNKDQWFSYGATEANITIWQTDSPKRPKGYFIVESFDLPNNETVCVLIDREWFFDEWNHDEQDQQIENFKTLYIQQTQQEEAQVS